MCKGGNIGRAAQPLARFFYSFWVCEYRYVCISMFSFD